MEARELLEIMDEHFSKGFFDNFGESDARTFRDELDLAFCKNTKTIDFEWNWDCGVSKFCIIPKHENWVLKIPFNTIYEECERTVKLIDDNGEEYEDYECIDEPYPIEGANSVYEVAEWDYCAAEAAAYDHATDLGIEKYFAETKLLGFVANYPVYIQEKAEIFCDRYSNGSEERKSYTPEERDEMEAKLGTITSKQGYCPELPSTTWMLDFLFCYGEKALEEFLEGLSQMSVEDLHNGNVGYVDNQPKLIDYSSWNS